MSEPTSTTVGTLSEAIRVSVEKTAPLVRLAEKTGIFFNIRLFNRPGDTTAYWPAGQTQSEQNLVWTHYSDWCEARQKRTICLTGYIEYAEPARPLAGRLFNAAIQVQDRVAMRFLNAPLQMISTDPSVPSGAQNYPVTCEKRGDHYIYRGRKESGASLILQVLLSQPVQNHIHNRNHYSRARRNGED